MESEKIDRRSERSRRLLHSALMELMREKRYDKITVQDIIDRANVGRSTFYTHYRDKEDLLVTNFEQMLATMSAHWLEHGKDPSHGSSQPIRIAALFHHTQEYYTLYEALVWGRGIELIHEQAQRFLSQQVAETLARMIPLGSEPQMPISMLANHIAATLGSLLRWWLEEGMPYTPEEMDGYFHQLITPVVYEVLQLQNATDSSSAPSAG